MKRILGVAASLLFMGFFTLSLARHVGINADAMYSYSFAKDIVERVSLTTWVLPAQSFIFPDTVFSSPVVFLLHDPVQALCVLSSLQIFFMIGLIAFFQGERVSVSFWPRFVAVTYVAVLVYFAGKIGFGSNWTAIADKAAVLDHHMFGALVALALQLWVSPERVNKTNSIFLLLASLIFLATSFSDPFCFLYFFAFVGARVLLLRQTLLKMPRWVGCISLFFVAGASGIFLNHMMNPDLMKQVQNSTATLDPSKFYHVIGWKGVVMLIGLPVLLLFARRASNNFKTTAFGLLLIVLGVAGAGLVGDKWHLRYVGIFFPAMLYLFVSLLPESCFRFCLKPVVSLAVIIFSMIGLPALCHDIRPALFQAQALQVLNCNAFQNKKENALVVATYWPAKTLFELSNRSFRLLQSQSDLQASDGWMQNMQWARPLHDKPSNDTVLFMSYRLSPDKLKAIAALPGSLSLCEGEVILAKQSPSLAIIAPILKQKQPA